MTSARGRVSLKSALTVLAAVLLLAPVIFAPAALLPPAAGAVIVIGLLAGLYWWVTDRDDADGEGSVWNAIPSRQYDGRHAESGGLSRGEQEAAIEEIQQDAADRDPEQ